MHAGVYRLIKQHIKHVTVMMLHLYQTILSSLITFFINTHLFVFFSEGKRNDMEFALIKVFVLLNVICMATETPVRTII